jgi:hypothetical protein
LVLFVLALLGALLCAVLPAIAEQPPPGLKMEAMPAFGGHLKFGEWLPVWLTLENGDADLRGEARVRVIDRFGATTFAAPISLPAGSQKRVPVYVLLDNLPQALEVQLVNPKEKTHLSLDFRALWRNWLNRRRQVLIDGTRQFQ